LFPLVVAAILSVEVVEEYIASTDLFLASALAMAFFTPCSAILSQSYGKSIAQFWHIFAVFWDKVHLINAILLRHDPIIMADIN
jgi:hypothetical protein